MTKITRNFKFNLRFVILMIAVLFASITVQLAQAAQSTRSTKVDWFLQPVWENATSFSEGLAAVSVPLGLHGLSGSNELWGFIDPTGRWAIEPKFADVWPFHEGVAAVLTIPDKISGNNSKDNNTANVVTLRAENEKWGFINPKGEFVIAPQFDFATPFNEGLAAVRAGDKWGYINKKGELAIETQFNLAGDFYAGCAVVLSDNNWKYIDKTGKPAFELQVGDSAKMTSSDLKLRGAWPFSENRAAVLLENSMGFINEKGVLVIAPQYQSQSGGRMFSEGLAAVSPQSNNSNNLSTREYGYIHLNGEWAIEPTFMAARDFSGGLAAVRRGGYWGYIDTSGQQAIAFRLNDAMSFSENIASVAINGQWGYIDKSGNWLLEPKLLEAMPFSEGVAAARNAKDGRWGYVARDIAPLFNGRVFDDAEPFSEGFALVRDGDQRFFIDANGQNAFARPDNPVESLTFDDAKSFTNGLAAVCIKGKWGCIDKQGKTAVPIQFESLGLFQDGLAPAKFGGQWGYIDKTGKWAIKNTYAAAWEFSEGLAAVQSNTKKGKFIGYINTSGKTIIPFKFGVPPNNAEAGSFNEGLAAVLINSKSGNRVAFIDMKGNTRIKANFKPWTGTAPRFHVGVAEVVNLKSEWIFIDHSGQQVKSLTSKANVNATTVAASPWRAASGLWGYRDADGVILVAPFLEHAKAFSDGKAPVSLSGKWWFIPEP